jgi:2-polyprenyl-3-methyl-5-hydroxy-6-metoxy-1,4-benzoquinol methylase
VGSELQENVTDEELSSAIREVQERVRSRVPQGSLGLKDVNAPDLMPLVHARDAAEAKVAAIGVVNPRPPGLKNSILQSFKRAVSRALDWHVREQVEFNRASMACVQATLEALTELTRGMSALAAYHQDLQKNVEDLRENLKDLQTNAEDWRAAFEERWSATEIRNLRAVSELQSGFHLRASLIEQNFRDAIRQQHDDFTTEMDRRTLDIQKRLWQDMEKIRGEYDRLIHTELRLLRQKQGSGIALPATPQAATASNDHLDIDWMRFAEQFRGSEDRIREQQKGYVARFAGAPGAVLDIGCGRGEFLEAAKAAGLPARGVDQNHESIALCRSKGLEVEQGDMFEYLESLAEGSLGGAYCAQVIEHLPPAGVLRLVNLLAKKLRLGALVAIETPNPECLAIFATHFYIDPTHTRPIPAPLLRFYLEEAGFGSVEIERLAPAVESMPALAELPPAFRAAFFGGLDYAVVARKL